MVPCFKHSFIGCFFSYMEVVSIYKSCDELLQVLDEDGNLTNRVETRDYVHKYLLYHDEVRIFVIKGDEILLERRSLSKDSNPGKLCVPGGHVSSGVTPLCTAKNELKEEIGLNISEENIRFINRVKQNQPNNNCFKNNFFVLTRKNINEFKKQDEEVESLKYVKFNDFIYMIKETDETTYSYEKDKDCLNKIREIIERSDYID